MAALMFLESQRTLHPDLSEWFSDLADLYQRKLWHQLTLKLEQFLALNVQSGDMIIQLYQNFISDFETKINLLKLAHFAVIVSRQYKERQDAINFLEEIAEKKLRPTRARRVEEPILYVTMQIAALKLQGGGQSECKALLEEGKVTLDSMTDVDPTVHASFHWVSSQYHKSRQDFAEFYRSAMMFLAFTSVESLSEPFKLDLAVDLSLAALLGENIYNFGELLAHPIVNSLIGSSFEWLYHLLKAFNEGDLRKYDELCNTYAAALNAQPALTQNARRLKQKITILCLMELIFSLPSEERTIPLATIAAKTSLDLDGTEHLLMKTLSAHLIEGVIDQVEGTVRVSWVQPRVLAVPQIAALRDRLDSWLGKVHSTLLAIEAETPELVPVM